MEDRSLERIADECQRKTWEKRRSVWSVSTKKDRVESRKIDLLSAIHQFLRKLVSFFFFFSCSYLRGNGNELTRLTAYEPRLRRNFDLLFLTSTCAVRIPNTNPRIANKVGPPRRPWSGHPAIKQIKNSVQLLAEIFPKKKKKNHRESDEDKWIGMTIPAIESRVNCKTVKGLDHVCKCQSPGASSLDRDETLAFRLTKMRASSSLDREI